MNETAPLARGDIVAIPEPFLVSRVNDDGTVVLARDLSPFAKPTTLDAVHPNRVTLLERSPIILDPRVGDTVTGATVQAVPWRRGTIIRETGHMTGNPASYVLTGSGQWVDLDADDLILFDFEDFDLDEQFVIVKAPGKERTPTFPRLVDFHFDRHGNVVRAAR